MTIRKAVHAQVTLSDEDEAADGSTITSEVTLSTTQFCLELLFIASPVPHAAFVLGPYVDLPLAGSIESEQDPPNTDPFLRSTRPTSISATPHTG